MLTGFDVMERWFWGSQDEVEGQKAKSMNWVGETEQRDLALSWDFSCSFPGQKAAAPRSPGGKNLCGFTESLNMGRTSQMRGDRVNCWEETGLIVGTRLGWNSAVSTGGVLWSLGLKARGQPGSYSQLMECAEGTFPTPTLCLAGGFF